MRSHTYSMSLYMQDCHGIIVMIVKYQLSKLMIFKTNYSTIFRPKSSILFGISIHFVNIFGFRKSFVLGRQIYKSNIHIMFFEWYVIFHTFRDHIDVISAFTMKDIDAHLLLLSVLQQEYDYSFHHQIHFEVKSLQNDKTIDFIP